MPQLTSSLTRSIGIFLLLMAMTMVKAQDRGISIQDLIWYEATIDGVRGMGASGVIRFDRKKWDGPGLGFHAHIQVFDPEKKVYLLDTVERLRVINRVTYIAPKEPENAWPKDYLEVFYPLLTLSREAGAQKLAARLTIYNDFMSEVDTAATSGWRYVTLNFPERQEKYIAVSNLRFANLDDSATKEIDAYSIYLDQDHASAISGKGMLNGIWDVGKDDLLEVGYSEEKTGRSGGFRLLGIQFTRGREYTYRDVQGRNHLPVSEIYESVVYQDSILLNSEQSGSPDLWVDVNWLSRDEFYRKFVPINAESAISVSVAEGKANGTPHTQVMHYRIDFPLQCTGEMPENSNLQYDISLMMGGKPIFQIAPDLLTCERRIAPVANETMDNLLGSRGRPFIRKFSPVVELEKNKGQDNATLSANIPFEALMEQKYDEDTTNLPMKMTFRVILGYNEVGAPRAIETIELPIYWKPILEAEANRQRKLLFWGIAGGGLGIFLIIGLIMGIKKRREKNKVVISDIQVGE